MSAANNDNDTEKTAQFVVKILENSTTIGTRLISVEISINLFRMLPLFFMTKNTFQLLAYTVKTNISINIPDECLRR